MAPTIRSDRFAVALEGMLRRALESLGPDRLWINPDCGLKTCRDEQAHPALAHLVVSARSLRAELDNGATLPGTGIDAASTETPSGS